MLSYIILYAALVTAVASAAHGGGYGRKGWIILLHTLSLPTAPIFWIFFRRGKHAKAELDYYSGKGELNAVQKAYPAPLGFIMARVMLFCKNNHFPHLTQQEPHDGRRLQQELAGGFVIGATVLAPALIALILIIRSFM